jgi:hypothetical protein
MKFRPIEENLRQSFRILADGRPRADVLELPGVSIASLGVAFQMFNAAFLSAPVETQFEMESRLQMARDHFETRGLAWSFWICEDWLTRPLRRRLSRMCQHYGLRLAAEMPGMIARRIAAPARRLPDLEVRRVDSAQVLHDFRAIGSTCFHVPPAWFSEVFNDRFAFRLHGCLPGWRACRDGGQCAFEPYDRALQHRHSAGISRMRLRGSNYAAHGRSCFKR